jgi:hypothetical protein
LLRALTIKEISPDINNYDIEFLSTIEHLLYHSLAKSLGPSSDDDDLIISERMPHPPFIDYEEIEE